ncbi:MAG: hypothetical protein RR672_09785 [Raoultibacter sp.]
MTNTRAFCANRSYASLGAGSFPIGSSELADLLESEVFIVYTNQGLGNTFAIKNITIEPADEHTVRISFDPLTDVTALPSSILPRDQLKEQATCQTFIPTSDLTDAPRFAVSNKASGNCDNLLSLDLEMRSRLLQYKGGMISLTELVLTLYEQGITICDIDQSVRQKHKYAAVLHARPMHVIDLNKDNGVVQDNLPLLARMQVLL